MVLESVLVADDMVLYIENPKDSTRKLLEIMTIVKLQDIKSTHRNPWHSCTLIKETIPFTIATKRIKYLGIYLPKETKDLYIENYNKHW